MIKTVLFDMGNVLIKFSHERMCRQIGDLCRRTDAEIRHLLFNSELQWNFERGFLSEAAFHAEVERLVEHPLELAHLVHAGSDIFEPNSAIEPIVAELKRRGYRLAVLSNTSISHFEFVRPRYDVLGLFDAYVLSYEVGALKPEPAIYEAALRAIKCAPDECFYTDDIPAYIEAARTYGLQAEVFTDAEALRGHLRARDIDL